MGQPEKRTVEISETGREYEGERRDPTDPATKERFLHDVSHVNPNANLPIISRAYDFARAAHEGQTRKSGEPYFSHLLETAYILLELKPGSSTLCAGLMHDVIEDTHTKPERIREEFGEEILQIIEGVSKIDRIGKHATAQAAENQRKIILAMAKDVRIVIVKLADRLHNMRTLKYLPAEKQKRIAQETLEIYAPIAYKLGMYKVKAELEDLCLRYLDPPLYAKLKDQVSQTRDAREKSISEAISLIDARLKDKDISAKIYGRAKHFYSIANKMRKKNLAFEELHDLLAIRILTERVEDCYRVLGVVHELFRPIPGQMSDYIANPKPNMYQSLHTDVIWKGKPLEIQIRTWEMQYTAEYGIASHWRYKGTERDKKFDERIEWLKQILEWQITTESADRFVENFKIDLFQNEIVVFTPKGDPIVLPEDATPIDFAYEIHTDIGNHTARAKVNNVLVPLDKTLEPGDIVEIITQKNARPSRSWLQLVKSTKARSKIRQALSIPLDGDPRKGEPDPENSEVVLRSIRQDSKRQLRYSRCCKPHVGDAIGGYVMKDGKIAVHRKDCLNYQAHAEGQNRVDLRWKQTEKNPNTSIRIETDDRIGMLADILNTIASLAIDVRKVRTKRGKESFFLYFELTLPAKNDQKRLIEALEDVPDVKHVQVLEA